MPRTRGAAGEPIPLKILKGTSPGHDIAGRPIPTPPAFNRGAPDPPDWLSGPARDLWDRVTPGLERLDLIKPEDYTTMVSYCETWATYLEALEQVRSGGLIVAGKGLISHKNPAVAVLEQAGLQLLRYAKEFGLTPVAEVALARVGEPNDDEDPFA